MKYLIVLFFLIPSVLAININEIMYNPPNSDNNLEFVEIYGTNNLTNYSFGDLAKNQTLTMLHFENNSNFSLIVEEGYNYNNISASIYTTGSNIGNGLNNGGDTITLYYNNTIIDQTTYSNKFGNGNGYSLELVENWTESKIIGGTPGKENQKIEEANNCNIDLSLETDKQKYNLSEKIKIYNKLNTKSYPFIITYWIEDQNGNIIKQPKNTTNTNQKSYTPKKSGNYFIKNNLYTECNNTGNTKNEKMVLVTEQLEDSLTIKKIYFPIKQNGKFKIKIKATRANSEDKIIRISIENKTKKIGEEYTINLEDKFKSTELTLTLQFPDECNPPYFLNLKGLNKEITEPLKVECQKTTNLNALKVKEDQSIKKENITESKTLINSPKNLVTGEIIYESTSKKAENINIYLFSGLIMAFIIYTIIKNGNNRKSNNSSDGISS